MKKFCALGIAICLTLFVSCGKQQTEAEKNAEIERQVQQRLAAERQAEEQQRLTQREADLNARESALVQKEQEQPAARTATPEMRATQIQQRDSEEVERRVDRRVEEEPATYNTFYTKLESYGAWRETSDYGYVWQPNEAERSRNWRPYTNGRWVYTDAGWTWYSEEPFGWATYHYGRWTRLRNVGWVWVPGDEWAPAWVSWRKSDDYVGWAPLPPEAHFDRDRGIHNWADNYYDIGPEEYAFVPTNDFGEQRIERTIVPIERNVTIVNRTTNVTNITYNNTTIVNQGPNYDELRQRTRQPIQRFRLERRASFESGNPQTVVRGEVIEMSAPAIAPARQADRPRAVKEKIAQTVVDRSWAGIRDKKAAEQARAKMKAEATPPAGAPPRAAAQAPNQQGATPAESATPVRNFPQRAKITPRPPTTATPAATPSMTATTANKSQAQQERIQAERQMKEAQKTQKEKMRAQEKEAQQQKENERQAQKAAQQQKMEELRKAKAAKSQPASRSPAISAAPRATPLVNPAASPPTAKATPSISAAPRVPPFVKPRATPTTRKPSPVIAKKHGAPSSPGASLSPSKPPSASPANSPDNKKSGKDKKKKADHGKASPSPSASAQQP